MLRQNCVLHPVRSVDHVVYSGPFGARNIDTLLFVVRWARCGYHKKRVGTCYTELVFLHLVRSVGHVVCSGRSEVRNINTLFFMLVWTQSRTHKKCMETCYSEQMFLHLVRSVGHVVPLWFIQGTNHRCPIIHALVGPVRIQEKAQDNTLCQTCPFAFSAIYGSRSAFWSIWGVNLRHNFFKLVWDRFASHKKREIIYYAKLVFLHPVKFADHVLHSDASRARNIDTLFFML
jgi:hypothetical protein